MSSEIIYHQTIVRVPASEAGQAQDIYLWIFQIGSSNCYEFGRNGGCGRRARSWQLASLGTREQVMRTAIYFARNCEGGMLKMRSASRGVLPETLIRSVRRLLADADKVANDWSFNDHSLTGYLRSEVGGAEKVYPPYAEGVMSFLADHPDWLTRRIASGVGHGRFTGPEMR